MPIPQQQLIEVLADGCFHSGEELGALWSVSRAAISKAIAKLAVLGLDVHAVRGKGYCLSEKLCLLKPATILHELPASVCQRIGRLDVLPVIASTNSHLLERLGSTWQLSNATYQVCLSEMQTAGRGRRGRQWLSPYGHNIYLSLLKEFPAGIKATEGFSLAISVALVRTLAAFGIAAQVKWPNDVLVASRKVAGILIEMRGDPLGACQVVIGIGVNVHLTRLQLDSITQPAISLVELGFNSLERNSLVAALLANVVQGTEEFLQEGFASCKQEWEAVDSMRCREVSVSSEREVLSGIASGVDERGALLLQIGSELRRLNSGELSVRVTSSAVSGQS